MRLTKLLFLCLYVTLHIQLIASFPSNNILLTDDKVVVGIYNPQTQKFTNNGLNTISIKQNREDNTISMIGKHNQPGSWSPIEVLNIKDVQLFQLQDRWFEWSYKNQRYGFRFDDSQRAELFHQKIQETQTGILSSSPTTIQFSQQISDDVNEESSTPGNQRDNGMLFPDQTQQSDYTKRFPYTADIWKFNDQNQEVNYGKSEIKIIKRRDKNTLQVVGERIWDKQILIDIYDITLVQLSLNNDYIVVYWGEQPYCGFQFQENHSANSFYQSMLKEQKEIKQASQVSSYINPSTTAIPQHHNSVYGAPGNVMDITHTTTASVDQNDVKLQSVQSHQNKADESSNLSTLSGNANILILNGQAWDTLGMSRLEIKQHQNNDKTQMVSIDNTNLLNVEDVNDVHLIPPHPTSPTISMTYQNRSYLLQFNDIESANSFYRAMLNAKKINPSQAAPAAPNQFNPMNGDPTAETSLDHRENGNVSQIHPEQNNEERRPRHICTGSTQYYDCLINRVNLKHNETHDFGLHDRPNLQQKIGFGQSAQMQYLPQSLIEAFPEMKLLNLNHLAIDTIEDNAFDTAGNLEALFLEGNRLSNFPSGVLRGAKKLETLVLTSNKINSIAYAFKSNVYLSELYVDKNELTKLPTFSNTAQLKIVNASHNKLADINSAQFARQVNIEDIDLSNNLLTNLNLQLPSRRLKTVDLSNNQLKSLTIPLTMQQLLSKHNQLSKLTVGKECYLKQLVISNNTLITQPNFKTCRLLEYIDLSSNLLEIFDLSEVSTNVRYLNLAHNNMFDIKLPRNSYPNLVFLDLSHNELSYLSSLQSFTSLNQLKLNHNHFIDIEDYNMPNSLRSFFASNNEWNCANVSKLEGLIKDADSSFCPNGLVRMRGICCKQYSSDYNLHEIISKRDFHDRRNHIKQKEICANERQLDLNDNIDHFRELATEVDDKRANIYNEMEKVKSNLKLLKQNQRTINGKKSQSSSTKNKMAQLIENMRKNYRVTKEGLTDDKEMLRRIIVFVEERDDFNKNLLSRRKGETETTNQLYAEKYQEKTDLSTTIEKQSTELITKKNQEKALKKQMDQLQKQVNRNAPSIHGKTGKS